MVRKTGLLIVVSLCTLISLAQENKRSITDYGRRFYYNNEEGITPSYISYFGKSFPQQDLQTITGKTIARGSLKNKVVVYNFWFIKCQPCIAEIPALNKLYDRYQSDSLEFIAITFDDSTTIQKFLEKKEFNFSIVSLDQGTISKMKKMSYYPMTFIVNRNQEISYAFFGKVDGKNPDEGLFSLLEAKLIQAFKE